MKLTPTQISKAYPDQPIQDLVQSDLSNKQITQIENTSMCISLSKLNLPHNELVSKEALPCLQLNKGLTLLKLSKNRIQDIGYLRNLKKLTVLNVSQNALSELPTSAIKMMESLKALIDNNNQIQDIPLNAKLPSSLTTIVLSNNKLLQMYYLQKKEAT